MIAFIDTNVLLDVLLNRESFVESSARLWGLCENGVMDGRVSSISFNNSYYVIKKIHSPSLADQAMRTMLDVFTVVSLDERLLNMAVDADFEDFEDAIQFFSALRCGADYLITRDVAHFSKEDIPVVSPEEFLSLDILDME